MKTKMMLYAVFAVFVLAAGFSGCIGNGNNDSNNMMNNSNNMMNRDEADIRSVSIAVNGSNVIASVMLDLDYGETPDIENISVKKAGDAIRISIHVFENTAGNASNLVTVPLGNVSDFKNGDYIVIVNNDIDKDEIITFRFENEKIVTIRKAFVSNVIFEADGNEIFAIAEIPNAGKYDTVDTQNITKTRFDHENEMDIYVPVMHKSVSADERKPLYAEIPIGELNQMKNGRYFVEINGCDASFLIQNGTLGV
ncbi:hypothetical protein MmiEs2_00070 [Methanimicrococcus stummii]|uniref:Uncharacterized protein n=1 Tax=Methanimicrococcus stummii TaxID=3028294 RepID=A0AA96V700_9EURY|nr:hypothetical protein [Methanimicrococcus sp. Es2]WNY27834.1 hypothetical protein MmiEs2_00070 [Methanimicrococcus sp. Es2]